MTPAWACCCYRPRNASGLYAELECSQKEMQEVKQDGATTLACVTSSEVGVLHDGAFVRVSAGCAEGPSAHVSLRIFVGNDAAIRVELSLVNSVEESREATAQAAPHESGPSPKSDEEAMLFQFEWQKHKTYRVPTIIEYTEAEDTTVAWKKRMAILRSAIALRSGLYLLVILEVTDLIQLFHIALLSSIKCFNK
jgi:hypothetical protein